MTTLSPTTTDATFLAVANKIANGDPPLWLLLSLNHFSKFIVLDPKLKSKEDREIDERMLEAAKYLSKWLPSYGLDEFGFECPDCVETVLNELPEVIELLEKDISEARTGAGRKSSVQRKICASVIDSTAESNLAAKVY